MNRLIGAMVAASLACGLASVGTGQESPTSEPSVRMLQKVIPTVVCITTEVTAKSAANPADRLFNELLGVPVDGPRGGGTGSGFFVTPDGYVLTNEHVAAGAAPGGITVTTQDGKTYVARVISENKQRDLALLKVDGKDPFPFIRLDDLSPNLLGQSVFVIGNPKNLGTSVSRGILSARARTLRMDGEEYPDLLQTDAAINPGNSGGPIVDLSGKLVGVSCMVYFGRERRQAVGLNFGVAGNVVHAKVQEFMQNAGKKPKPAKTGADIPGF